MADNLKLSILFWFLCTYRIRECLIRSSLVMNVLYYSDDIRPNISQFFTYSPTIDDYRFPQWSLVADATSRVFDTFWPRGEHLSYYSDDIRPDIFQSFPYSPTTDDFPQGSWCCRCNFASVWYFQALWWTFIVLLWRHLTICNPT